MAFLLPVMQQKKLTVLLENKKKKNKKPDSWLPEPGGGGWEKRMNRFYLYSLNKLNLKKKKNRSQ